MFPTDKSSYFFPKKSLVKIAIPVIDSCEVQKKGPKAQINQWDFTGVFALVIINLDIIFNHFKISKFNHIFYLEKGAKSVE